MALIAEPVLWAPCARWFAPSGTAEALLVARPRLVLLRGVFEHAVLREVYEDVYGEEPTADTAVWFAAIGATFGSLRTDTPALRTGFWPGEQPKPEAPKPGRLRPMVVFVREALAWLP